MVNTQETVRWVLGRICPDISTFAIGEQHLGGQFELPLARNVSSPSLGQSTIDTDIAELKRHAGKSRSTTVLGLSRPNQNISRSLSGEALRQRRTWVLSGGWAPNAIDRPTLSAALPGDDVVTLLHVHGIPRHTGGVQHCGGSRELR